MSTTTAEPTETTTDGPLLDLTDAGVKRFIKQAKARGYVTMDELNKVLPSEEVTSEQIEDTLAMLSEMGVNVVENDEVEGDGEAGEGGEVAVREESAVTVAEKPESFDRTDDPVRMYLREMGSVELLSREGEIAIAKRIEAGRDTMIRGLCESALTFEAIMVWREELGSGRILLREVIDLEQTYGGQPGAAPLPTEGGELIEGAEPAPVEAKAPTEEGAEPAAEGEGDSDEDDFDDGAGPSVSAMEAELREGVMATLDAIAAEFEAFRKLQEKLVERRLNGEDLPEKDRKQYEALSNLIIQHLKTLKLNNNRIEALVEQLYAINKRLMGLEGRLLSPGRQLWHLAREFLKAYFGSELAPDWTRNGQAARRALDQVRRERLRPDHRYPPGNRHAGHRDRRADRRLSPHRADGAEGRARGPPGQEGNGRGQPAPGHLHRQEIHQPRPAVPGPDPGRQHRPDEGGRQVRVPPRLQVLHLRHLVDPSGHHPLASPIRRAPSAFLCT